MLPAIEAWNCCDYHVLSKSTRLCFNHRNEMTSVEACQCKWAQDIQPCMLGSSSMQHAHGKNANCLNFHKHKPSRSSFLRPRSCQANFLTMSLVYRLRDDTCGRLKRVYKMLQSWERNWSSSSRIRINMCGMLLPFLIGVPIGSCAYSFKASWASGHFRLSSEPAKRLHINLPAAQL